MSWEGPPPHWDDLKTCNSCHGELDRDERCLYCDGHSDEEE